MADLLSMSSRIIDEGSGEPAGPINRINHELSELSDEVEFSALDLLQVVEGFGVGDRPQVLDESGLGHADSIVDDLDQLPEVGRVYHDQQVRAGNPAVKVDVRMRTVRPGIAAQQFESHVHPRRLHRLRTLPHHAVPQP